MLFACTAHADGLQPIPALTGHVVDTTGTLSQVEATEFETTLANLEREKGAQVVVLVVPTVAPEPIEQFGIRAGDAWKLGRKGIDDGAILLVALRDRRMRIEVGRGLEGALTDATSKRIIAETISPRFKQNDFAGGVRAGIDSIANVVRGEPLPVKQVGNPSTTLAGHPQGWLARVLFFAAALFFVGSMLLNAVLGRVFGSFVTGGLMALLIGIAFSSFFGAAIAGALTFVMALWRGTGGGGFGGGGFWGGGFGGGRGAGGGGGYSGGGGSFGGGGASGDW